MSMKINGPGQPGSVVRPERSTTKKADDAGASEKSGPVEKVELSGSEQAAKAARAAETPEIDRAKVTALRAAIRSGDYSPNLKLVAERMINEAIALNR